MAVHTRGKTLTFRATCLDEAGLPVTPNTANVYLVFTNLAGVRTHLTVAMTIAANVVSATWDSAVAAGGLLTWSIRAVGSSTIVEDGSETLSANEANPTS